MLHVENLSKRIGDFALHGINFDVPNGGYFVLLGASGAGKTVLLEMLAGIESCDDGRIRWNDEDITHARIQHRGFSLVYQDQALFPHLSVRANIAYGLRARGMRGHTTQNRFRALARETGVEALLDRMPETLSGGEAQRVALARALAVEPRCLLLDEPIAALDTHARGHMRALLRGLNRQGHTIIHVTHDYEEAISLATHVGVMERGTVVQTGTPEEIFHHPRSEFVARFIGIRNVYKGRLLAAEPEGTPKFTTGNRSFAVLTDASPGPGSLIVRSEDITVSLTRNDTSAQNTFRGIVKDIAPARLGVEVTVEIGVEATAWITNESLRRLQLRLGSEVWTSFKASAARFIEE